MKTPFLKFLNTIAVDDGALKRFLADPAHSPEAAGLRKDQKTAVLSTDISAIYELLIKENPNVQDDIESGRVFSPAFDIPRIAWNMHQFQKRVEDAEKNNRGNQP